MDAAQFNALSAMRTSKGHNELCKALGYFQEATRPNDHRYEAIVNLLKDAAEISQEILNDGTNHAA